jgi:amidase
MSERDAVGQAAAVRAGLPAVDVVCDAVDRISQVDSQLNAVIHRRFDRALEEAACLPGSTAPFAGVPLLVKDALCQTAGDPYHFGMRLLAEPGWRASTDSYLARRFRAAGFIILGRTNTPELATAFTTEPAAYGPTANPWDTTRSPGGSSGGSAAAVAAGLVPVAHGNDMGGSLRVPASNCGLVGLKPSRARTSLGPQHVECFSFLTHEGVMTRSVRDTAAVLDAVAGPSPGDPYQAPPLRRPLASALDGPPAPLRIGVVTKVPVTGKPAHPECVRAAEHTAGLLEQVGHAVQPTAVDAFEHDDPSGAAGVLFSVFVRRELERWQAELGVTVGEADVELRNWVLGEAGRAVSAAAYLAALEQMHSYARRVVGWWGDSGSDLLLTPTVAYPPAVTGKLVGREAEQVGAFTIPFNFTGQPAVSLPLHWTSEGLPVGAQLVAPYGREDLLIGVARQLEEIQPWAQRKPPVHAGKFGRNVPS